jgi:hypothetical protein
LTPWEQCDPSGQAIVLFISSRSGHAGAAAKLLTRDEARRIAANIAKLQEHVWQVPLDAKPT